MNKTQYRVVRIVDGRQYSFYRIDEQDPVLGTWSTGTGHYMSLTRAKEVLDEREAEAEKALNATTETVVYYQTF